MKKRVVIYVRVSQVKMDYNRQIEDLQELAKQRNFIVVKVFKEKISGTKTKQKERPELQKALEYIRKESIDKLLMWEISRLDRTFLPTIQLIEELSNSGVSTVIYKPSIIETLDDKGNKNPFASLMFVFLAYIAQQETETSTERIKSKLRSNARIGKAGGGALIAYGYMKDEEGFIIKNEQEAEIVQMIFDLSLQGVGTGAIARKLNKLSIPTRTQKLVTGLNSEGEKYKIKPGKWAGNTILSILRRTDYYGTRVFKDVGNVPCPQIIEKEKWDLVQVQLGLNFNENSRNTKHFYMLKGLLKCSCCGRNYIGKKRSDGTENYYQCSSRLTGYDACGNKGIGIPDVDAVVWNYLKHTKFSRDYIEGTLNTENDSDSLAIQKEIKEIQKEIDYGKRKINSLLELYLNREGYGMDAVKKQINKIEKGIARNTRKQNKLKIELLAIEKIKDRRDRATIAFELIESMKIDKQLVREVLIAIVDKIEVEFLSSSTGCRLTIFIVGDNTPYKLTIHRHKKIYMYGHELQYPPEGFNYVDFLLE